MSLRRKLVISDRQLALPLTAQAVHPSKLWWLNLTLMLAAGALLLTYIIIANQTMAARYSLQRLQGRLAEASAALETASVARYSLEDLVDFAKRAGLVEAKDAGALFIQSGVALENAVAR